MCSATGYTWNTCFYYKGGHKCHIQGQFEWTLAGRNAKHGQNCTRGRTLLFFYALDQDKIRVTKLSLQLHSLRTATNSPNRGTSGFDTGTRSHSGPGCAFLGPLFNVL